jgi:hypothetical protein
MKKSVRISLGIAVALFLALIALFGLWFWSLGEAHAGQPPAIRIESVKPPVEWHRAGESEWSPLPDGVDAQPGDSVRTGAGGEARIVWGDRGTTRLDESSELVLDAIPEDGTLNPGAQIKLKLESGRVWSRVIKLLDLGSTVQVDANTVVATVRGTSFGAVVDATGAEFAVTQSVVEINGASGTRTLLTDNRWGDFDRAGNPLTVRNLQPTDEWAARNRVEDIKEERDELAAWRERLKSRANALDNAPAFLIDTSESFHLSLASGAEKEALAAAYAERRLARLSVSKNEDDAKQLGRYVALAGTARGRLLGDWHALATLRAQTGEGDASDARTQRASLGSGSPAARQYLVAVAIDDRIDDFLSGPSRDPGVVSGLRADIDAFNATVDGLEASDAEKTGLHRKAEAMRARIEGADQVPVPEAAPIPAPGDTPKPGTLFPDTVKKPPQVIKPSPTTGTTQPVSYVRYQLLAAPSTLTVGQVVKLTMFGITATGQADDLTARASFTSAPVSGSFSGATFTPSTEGTIVFTGTVDGHSATASVVVGKAAPTGTGLQSITIQLTGPAIMGCSAYNTFKVIATYATGKTADVTMLSNVSVTDPKLLYVNDGTLMSFCTVDTAIANITASYTENQVTKTASQPIEVAKDPSSASKDCKFLRC